MAFSGERAGHARPLEAQGTDAAQQAAEAPANLARLVAHRESETEAERNEYMYRQTVTLEELDGHGAARGMYREVRDIIFSPTHERTEETGGFAAEFAEGADSDCRRTFATSATSSRWC